MLEAFWPTWSTFLDGNWFDICSLLGGLAYATYRCCRTKTRHPFISKQTGLDVANGVGLFPLLMLALASVSTSALSSLLASNKLILSVAGVLALLAILDDTD